MYVGESGCEARARAPSPSCATTHATGSPSARGARANARLAATGKALRAVPSGPSPARTRAAAAAAVAVVAAACSPNKGLEL
jgi:hypothetical protein